MGRDQKDRHLPKARTQVCQQRDRTGLCKKTVNQRTSEKVPKIRD